MNFCFRYSVNFNNFYHVALPNTTGRGVEIKKILTEPGEKGVAFLVIAVDNGFYHIYQVNATTSLGTLAEHCISLLRFVYVRVSTESLAIFYFY